MLQTQNTDTEEGRKEGMDMANIGYIRVSTAEQHTTRQETAFEGIAALEKVYVDKCSGKDRHRPQLTACMDYLREGDTLYVNEYSRLARSTQDLLNIITELKNKGVRVVSLKEKFDTDTPQGRLMLTMIASINQFERELMLQRQREGIAEAKKAGKYKGRKAKDKPPQWAEWYQSYKTRGMTATELAKRCGVSRTVLYRWFNEEEGDKRENRE